MKHMRLIAFGVVLGLGILLTCVSQPVVGKGAQPNAPVLLQSKVGKPIADSQPVYRWHTFFGAGVNDQGLIITVDGNGNVYVAGYSRATWNGPGGQAPLHAYGGGNSDIVVVKLNSGGAYQWHTFYGGLDDDYGNAIALDSNGNVYVSGWSEASWQGDNSTDPLHAYAGGNGDFVLLKLNSAGAYQWHTFYGSGDYDDGYDIAFDANNNIYVTGRSSTTWQGDGNTNPLHAWSGGNDLTVIKLNSNGVYQWHTFYGGGNHEGGYGIAVDGSSNIYITGWSFATWQGDGGVNPLHAHNALADIAVLKLNSDGSYQWHTFYGSADYDYGGFGIAVDSSANVYVAGHSGTWNGPVGQAPLHPYTGGIVALKLNSNGDYQWHTFYGSSSNDIGYNLALDDSANIYVAAYSRSSWRGDGNANPLHAFSGGKDIVMLKLNSNGVYQWHTFYGSSADDEGDSIAIDRCNNLYVVGYSMATWQGDGNTNPLHAHSGQMDLVTMKLAEYACKLHLPLILR